MYSDEESYATYIKAYKQYMVDVATILVNTVESLKLSTTTAFATAGRPLLILAALRAIFK